MRNPLAGSPTVDLLVVFVVVYVVQSLLELLLGPSALFLFALTADVGAQPWTLVTSVYSHANLGHLVANAVALVLVGLVLERATTRLRFHAFVVVTGALSGLAQVYAAGLFAARNTAVLGASGAVLALYGYVLTGNRLTDGVLSRFDISAEVQLLTFALLAVVVTLATGAPGVALVAHFTGLFLGLVAGRLGVLASGRASRTAPENTSYK